MTLLEAHNLFVQTLRTLTQAGFTVYQTDYVNEPFMVGPISSNRSADGMFVAVVEFDYDEFVYDPSIHDS